MMKTKLVIHPDYPDFFLSQNPDGMYILTAGEEDIYLQDKARDRLIERGQIVYDFNHRREERLNKKFDMNEIIIKEVV